MLQKMTIVLIALAVLAAAGPAGPAHGGDTERRQRISSIAGEVFSGSEAYVVLRVLSDEIGGRVTGTERGRRARAYVERLMNSYGLVSVHQEEFELHGWQNVSLSCSAVEPFPHILRPVPLANTPSTPREGIRAEVVDAGHGHPLELEKVGERIRGSLALVMAGAMPGGGWMHRSEVMSAVAEAGAAGLLYQTTRDGHLPMTGMCWKNGVAPVPGIGIASEDGAWIRRQIQSRGSVVLDLSMTNLDGPATSANVVGEISGRSNETVLVVAHLDSWDLGQGSVDNGTGCAVVLEAARALAASGIRPEATIRFVLTMGEEMGLLGAEAYAEAHSGEMARCRAMINCDMEGVPTGIGVMGREDSAPWFESLAGDLGAFGLEGGISHGVSIYGDQQPFLLAGVPVVSPVTRLEDGASRYYHTRADTYDKVRPGQLALGAAFVASLAVELAATPERVMEHLGRRDVERMIEENGLSGRLAVWGKWPLE